MSLAEPGVYLKEGGGEEGRKKGFHSQRNWTCAQGDEDSSCRWLMRGLAGRCWDDPRAGARGTFQKASVGQEGRCFR